jgi:hypothetical protein
MRFWSAKTGAEVRRFGNPRSGGVDWSPDGTIVATGSGQLFDVRSGEALPPLEKTAEWRVLASLDHPAWAKHVAISTTGVLLESKDQSVRWWQLSSGKALGRCAPLPSFDAIAASRDGRRLVVRGMDLTNGESTYVVWDLVANRKLSKIPCEIDNCVLAVAPDGSSFASGHSSVQLFDLVGTRSPRAFGESRARVVSLAYAPHGKILAAGRDDESVELWDVRTQTKIAGFRTRQGRVSALAFSSDGRTLATGGADSTVLLWKLHDILSAGADKSAVADLWQDMNREPVLAYRALEALAARPAESMPLFRENVKPRTLVPADRLARLLADLDADGFAQRDQATRELVALGDVVELDLKKLQRETSSPEVARRAAGILDRLANGTRADERSLRAVLALEAIATADAIRLLEELGRGAPGAGLTLEARAATERIARRRQAVQ